MRATETDIALDDAAVRSVCAGADRVSGLLTKREFDTLGNVTAATKLKADVILDAVEARFGVRPATVWGAGPNPEHNNLRCIDVMITVGGGWFLFAASRDVQRDPIAFRGPLTSTNDVRFHTRRPGGTRPPLPQPQK